MILRCLNQYCTCVCLRDWGLTATSTFPTGSSSLNFGFLRRCFPDGPPYHTYITPADHSFSFARYSGSIPYAFDLLLLDNGSTDSCHCPLYNNYFKVSTYLGIGTDDITIWARMHGCCCTVVVCLQLKIGLL